MAFNNPLKDFRIRDNVNIVNSPFYIDETETIIPNYDNATNTLTNNLREIFTPNSFGSSTQIPVISVDQYGRITSISLVTSTPIQLKTDGILNTDQNKLNLIGGAGITLIPGSNGNVTIESDLVTSTNVLIDGGGYINPNIYTLIDAGGY
jgi:hypothetical protein